MIGLERFLINQFPILVFISMPHLAPGLGNEAGWAIIAAEAGDMAIVIPAILAQFQAQVGAT